MPNTNGIWIGADTLYNLRQNDNGVFMSYHIFEVNQFKQLKFLETCPDYRTAKTRVRELRRASSRAADSTYRMIFAADINEAERLLKEKREARPMGEYD